MATIGLALQARELGCLSGNNLRYPVYQDESFCEARITDCQRLSCRPLPQTLKGFTNSSHGFPPIFILETHGQVRTFHPRFGRSRV